jgi:hypothetical protein
MIRHGIALALVVLVPCVVSCGGDDDDDNGTEATRRGLGAACGADGDCAEAGQKCLLNFKGGYCGVPDCKGGDCPAGSACVAHDDGKSYCFLVCVAKTDCNVSRPVEVESNCAGNITGMGDAVAKACVPPSGS